MSRQRIADFHQLSAVELRDKHRTLTKELVQLRVRATAVGVERPSEFRRLRQTIAQVLTALREKEQTT